MATTAARLPPALSPPTARREASTPRSAACVAHPARGGDAVVHGSREAVLRAHAVVHRHHRATGAEGQLAAQRVVRVQVADDPAAAVVVHQHRRRRLALGRGLGVVQAQRDRTQRSLGHQVARLGDGRRLGLRHGAALAVETARLGRAQRVRRRYAALDHQVEQELRLGMQHRCAPTASRSASRRCRWWTGSSCSRSAIRHSR